MNVFFRVDSSLRIGTGHVVRCMTLAAELKKRGVVVTFVCREALGHLCDFIEQEGLAVIRLPFNSLLPASFGGATEYADWLEATQEQDAVDTIAAIALSGLRVDCLVVDHYGLDHYWERVLRASAGQIMVIDDLANRQHDCDLLLDQNLYDRMDARYDGLIPLGAVQLLGPEYALLRSEFAQSRKQVLRSGVIDRILVFFGGNDLGNITMRAVNAIEQSRKEFVNVDIIVGVNNPNRQGLEAETSRLVGFECHVNVKNMAEFMARASMCIGAAGGTTWERCCLGLPSMVVSVADNQIQTVKSLYAKDILYYVGDHTVVSIGDIASAVEMFCSNPEIVRRYSENSFQLVDGMGAQRCADAMLSMVQN